MHSVFLALAMLGQYPTPQYQSVQYQAASTYSAPMYAPQPQVVMLGAGQVLQPGPFGMMLGHIGRKLEMHSWPRVQPSTMMAQPPVQQTIYLQVSQPQVQQAVYTVAMPQYQLQAPPVQYGAPQLPAKGQPQTYSSPQAPQYQAPRPSESVPPVPQR